jgi:phage gpG-like protein
MNIFSRDALKLQNAYRKAMRMVGATAVNFSKERFVRKNWVDRTPVGWEKTEKKKGSTLVASGQLKRSIRIQSMNAHKIIIGSDIPYAKIHNEGGTINKSVKVKGFARISMKGKKHDVKPHTRQMNLTIPKRQFIGVSAILERRIERTLDRVFKEALTN